MTKILVVDDSESYRNDLKELLESQNYDCVTAKNGKEGLELFKKHSDFALIITDINMPIMTGFQMCQRIKEISQSTPIIALSSGNLSNLKDKAKQAGVYAWIVKPFDQEEFLKGLEIILREQA